MQVVNLICPHCGATLSPMENRRLAYCTYCGKKLLLEEDNEIKIERIKSADNKEALIEKERLAKDIAINHDDNEKAVMLKQSQLDALLRREQNQLEALLRKEEEISKREKELHNYELKLKKMEDKKREDRNDTFLGIIMLIAIVIIAYFYFKFR